MAAKKQTRRVTKEAAWKGLREQLMAEHAKRVKEGGSDHLRGANQDEQIRAMFHKDHGDYYPGDED